jgi:hypothetical protein
MWKELVVAVGVISASGLASCVVVPEHERHEHRRVHDEDRDGIRDRADRDRDGDGVPNGRDRRPDDPRRY